MNTLFLSAADPQTTKIAADIIQNGGLVALPTETVYGLGANGLQPDAVKKIFEAKGRPQDNPLILHIADPAELEDLCHDIPPEAWALAAAFWPGPLTMVLPAKDIVPLSTRAGLPSVAVRCPDCSVTRDIIRLSGVPIAAPSANISGKPSTTTAEHVRHDHDGRIDCIVDGGPCRVGVESTIIDLTDERPRLLRPGAVTMHAMLPILGDIVIDKAVTHSVDQDAVVKAPGMKYKHYAPACNVVILDGAAEYAAKYVAEHFQPGNRVLCFEEELEVFAPFNPLSYGRERNPDSLMAGLFTALRELDDPGIGTVFARCPRGDGKALAVQNRLEKAAGFQRIRTQPIGTVIGITGGTGCGKTTLLNALGEAGVLLIDCDRLYHELLMHNRELIVAIEARFPGCTESGTLLRKKLGNIVFNDPEALKDLNTITHGAIRAEVQRRLNAVPGGWNVAIDAVALFESGLADLCDTTVAVTAPTEDRVKRLMERDNIPEDYARSRIHAQPDNGWFKSRCAHVLENNGSAEDFQKKCLAFLASLGIMKP